MTARHEATTRLLRSLERTTIVATYIASAVTALMMVHIVLDVCSKYLFNHPIAGTLETTAYYYMVAIVFLPLGYLELKDRGIAVDLFYNHFSRNAKRLTGMAVSVLSVGFYGILTLQSYESAMQSFGIRESAMGSADISIWPSRWLLALSFAAAFVSAFAGLLVRLLGIREEQT